MKDYGKLIRLIMETGFQVIGQVSGQGEPRALQGNEIDYPQDTIQLQKTIYGYKCLSDKISLEEDCARQVMTHVFKFLQNCNIREDEITRELVAKAKHLNAICREFGCNVELVDEGLKYTRSNKYLTKNNAYSPGNHFSHNVYLFPAPEAARLEAFIESDRVLCNNSKQSLNTKE